jgi:hypothetical protein
MHACMQVAIVDPHVRSDEPSYPLHFFFNQNNLNIALPDEQYRK